MEGEGNVQYEILCYEVNPQAGWAPPQVTQSVNQGDNVGVVAGWEMERERTDGALCDNSTILSFDSSFIYILYIFPQKYSHSQGMRMSGEAVDVLHLSGVERESAGTYACSALNTEGETRSSHLTLRVQCK